MSDKEKGQSSGTRVKTIHQWSNQGKRLKSKDIKNKTETIRQKIKDLIDHFPSLLEKGGLRQQVLGLVPVFKQLRNLGKSLIKTDNPLSARERILFYFKKYPNTPISGDELLVVSGIQEYARRIRELRVQLGWSIISGVTVKEMSESTKEVVHGQEILSHMKPSDYMLTSLKCDRDAAYRWNQANSLRKKPISTRDKILEFFRQNIGRSISGEELRYLAAGRTEWARRVRELRTEFGWPIVTRNTGREDLDVGIYVLEADRQSPVHDRKIPDEVRMEVLERDRYKCRKCGWSHEKYSRSDPRHLELHHVKHHAKGGENTEANLITICTSCHDKVHRDEK